VKIQLSWRILKSKFNLKTVPKKAVVFKKKNLTAGGWPSSASDWMWNLEQAPQHLSLRSPLCIQWGVSKIKMVNIFVCLDIKLNEPSFIIYIKLIDAHYTKCFLLKEVKERLSYNPITWSFRTAGNYKVLLTLYCAKY
jgi:hypothetical protein